MACCCTTPFGCCPGGDPINLDATIYMEWDGPPAGNETLHFTMTYEDPLVTDCGAFTGVISCVRSWPLTFTDPASGNVMHLVITWNPPPPDETGCTYTYQFYSRDASDSGFHFGSLSGGSANESDPSFFSQYCTNMSPSHAGNPWTIFTALYNQWPSVGSAPGFPSKIQVTIVAA